MDQKQVNLHLLVNNETNNLSFISFVEFLT